MSVVYTKRKNTSLFASLEKQGYQKIQNYIPTYKNFFVLNNTNYNSINISGQWFLKKIHTEDEDTGFYSGVVENSQNSKTKNVDIFIKNAPLLDPIKYMIGAHQSELSKISNLPQLIEGEAASNVIDKVNNPSNSSYIDNLFNIINSQLLEKGFVHGIEWYGSFLAIKKDFEFNIYDDLDYLFHSKYFLKNVGTMFHVPKEILEEIQKPTLKIEDHEEGSFDDFEDITDASPVDIVPIPAAAATNSISTNSTSTTSVTENEMELADPMNVVMDAPIDLTLLEYQPPAENDIESMSNSSYSSRTSYTNEYTDITHPTSTDGREDDDESCPDLVESYSGCGGGKKENFSNDEVSEMSENDSQEEEGSMGSSYEDDEYIGATIPEFPVQLICIEACEDTLDSLMLNEELTEPELFSCMMQIIMILATYQKLYKFTHNDLHTNNVMFVETNKKFIRYEYNGKKYLVPTYGKIYKIIDFGRSIFTIQDQVFCGDCYQKNGDAYTQYNFGPCLNDSKPTVAPNYSFDLCRLACSMFDNLITNISDIQNLSTLSPFKQLVARLCTDDKGLNVLYKRNHEERYPCFKLYKMISRTVHKHTPDLLLETPDFNKYINDGSLPAGVSKKECYYINIDGF
jgi:hypothetical protein